jgi:hypothetical protein
MQGLPSPPSARPHAVQWAHAAQWAGRWCHGRRPASPHAVAWQRYLPHQPWRQKCRWGWQCCQCLLQMGQALAGLSLCCLLAPQLQAPPQLQRALLPARP